MDSLCHNNSSRFPVQGKQMLTVYQNIIEISMVEHSILINHWVSTREEENKRPPQKRHYKTIFQDIEKKERKIANRSDAKKCAPLPHSSQILPFFDAWKLSCGGICSICAFSLDRGSIVRSLFIRSTALWNAISCFISAGWKRPPATVHTLY